MSAAQEMLDRSAIRVTSTVEGRRRGGFKFGKEPSLLSGSEVSLAAVAAMLSDRALVVEVSSDGETFEVPAPAIVADLVETADVLGSAARYSVTEMRAKLEAGTLDLDPDVLFAMQPGEPDQQLTTLQAELEEAREDLAHLRTANGDLLTALDEVRKEVAAKGERIAELEEQLAAATASAGSGESEGAADNAGEASAPVEPVAPVETAKPDAPAETPKPKARGKKG